jgi:uncharacterized protein YkwD
MQMNHPARKWTYLILGVIGILAAVSVAGGQPTVAASGAGPQSPASYPPDPTADIPWSAGTAGVADIQAAFNNARTTENTQLGLSLPMLTMPSQAEWDALSNSEKALWLINRERSDRGLAPLHGVETNVTGVAQTFAQYLLDNNTWGHDADGRTPWERLEDNPTIGACHDFLNIAENLAVFVTSGSSIALPVERSVYGWMYDDADSGWGHRHAILWYPYSDNSGSSGQEGFIGIGRANGGPYQGPFSQSWNFAELVVMNVFDPCATWNYGSAPEDQLSYLPIVLKNRSGSPPATYSISGSVTDNHSAALEGVTISADAGRTALTDASGAYMLSGLPAGAYTLTPSKTGYTFDPASIQVSVPPNASGQSFVGAASAPSDQRLVIFEAFLRET